MEKFSTSFVELLWLFSSVWKIFFKNFMQMLLPSLLVKYDESGDFETLQLEIWIFVDSLSNMDFHECDYEFPFMGIWIPVNNTGLFKNFIHLRLAPRGGLASSIIKKREEFDRNCVKFISLTLELDLYKWLRWFATARNINLQREDFITRTHNFNT